MNRYDFDILPSGWTVLARSPDGADCNGVRYNYAALEEAMKTARGSVSETYGGCCSPAPGVEQAMEKPPASHGEQQRELQGAVQEKSLYSVRLLWFSVRLGCVPAQI
jgi:hypothetical protein